VFFADDVRIQDAAGARQRINRRVNGLRGDGAVQRERPVQVSEHGDGAGSE